MGEWKLTKFYKLTLCFLFVILFVSCVEAAEISAPTGEMHVNDSCTVSVNIADVASAEGISFTLNYDTSLLSIQSASANASYPGLDVTANINDEAGRVRVLATSVQHPITATSSTPIVDIVIQSETEAGLSALLLSDAEYSSNFLPINFDTAVDGAITVLGPPVDPQPPVAVFSATPTAGKVPLEELTIYTQIRKDPRKYDIKSPELSAAEKAVKRGMHIERGMIIGYVITKAGASISDRAELLEFAKD